MSAVGEILQQATTVLDRAGWCQGTLVDDGAVCAYGAINTAVMASPSHTNISISGPAEQG